MASSFRGARAAATLICLFLLLTNPAFAQGQLLTKEAFSRELSIHVGGEQTPLVKDIASREVSIFVGQEPARPYAQAISREMSIVVTTLAFPARVAELNVGVSPTGDRAELEWCGYNEVAQSDVVRYRIYVSTAPFTTVSNLLPHAIVPAGTCTLIITNLPPWHDHYFAVVAEDALGGSDYIVSYSAAYVLAPQALTREFSIFVGGEPAPAYAQALSREVSLLISTPEPPQRITQLNVTPSPTGDRATLEWCGYNELLQRDVVRYDIFLSTSVFTSVSNLTRFATVPAGTCSITLSNLTAFQDRYFAVVPVDAIGAFDPAVDYSAAYVLAPQAISRELSVFVGGEPDTPYAQAISREFSILVPDNTVPDPVTGLTSGFLAGTSVSTFSAIDLNWSSYNEVQQRDVLRYRIYTAPSFSTDVSTMELRTNVPAGAFRFTLGGLFGGAIYYVAVVAEDVLGNLNPTVRSASAQASIGALGEVRDLMVNSSIDSLSITWTAPEQVDAFLNHYNLYLGGSTNPISLTNTALTYTATGLQPATGYPLRFSTVDTFGTESSGVSQVAATWLPNPSNVVAQSFDGMVRLTWSHAEPNDLVKHYVVYNSHRGENFNDVTGLIPLLTTRDTHVDLTGVPNGTLDFFAITTVNISDGENPRVTTVSATPNPVPGVFADLVLTNVVSPASVHRGQSITIDWTVTNVGAGSTSTRNGAVVNSWSDRVVLSSDMVLGDADDIALAIAPHVGVLSAGGSYAASATAQIPTNLTGFYHVFVQANAGGQVYEHLDAAANIGIAPQTMFVGSSLPPGITQQPTNLVANVYDNAQLSVSASGLPPPAYQWRLNGSVLAGQTSAVLAFTNVQPWQAGNYDVVIANVVGSVTSVVARLTVLPAANPICVPSPSGLVGWWPGDGNANDLAGGHTASLQNGAWMVTGMVGEAFAFDGVDDYARIVNSGDIIPKRGSHSFCVWVKPEIPQGSFHFADMHQPGGGVWIFGLEDHFPSIYVRDTQLNGVGATSAIPIPNDEYSHLGFVIDRAVERIRLFVNGTEVASSDLANIGDIDNSTPLVLGNPTINCQSCGILDRPFRPFKGTLDEATIWNRALTSNEIASIYAAGSAGMCKPQVPPSILAQPTNVTVFATMPATLRVQALGDEPLGYQWRFNGGVIAGGTNATLTFPSAQESLAGTYDVIVSNPLGSVTSVVATLIVRTDIPDFALRSLSFPTNALAGQTVPLVVSVTNQGSGSALATWVNAISLATNANGDGVLPLGSFAETVSLPSGTSIALTQTVIVPFGLSGLWYPVFTVNSDSQVFESNRANNTLVAARPIAITAPDLEVTLLTVPSNGVFGQPLTVTWVVRNRGTGSTFANWSDAVFLSRVSGTVMGVTPLGSAPAMRVLAPGQSYTNTLVVTMPLSSDLLSGTNYVVLQADVGNTQPESNESNNLASGAIPLTLPPLPDLVIGSLSTPTLASPGRTIAATWIVTNRGPATASGPWTETLHIVSDEVTGVTSAVELQRLLTSSPTLGTFAYSNTLAPGEFLTRTQLVTLPLSGISGKARLVATVDARDEVFEEWETNNLSFADNDLTIPVSLTLHLSSSQISENAIAPLRATLARNGSLTQALTVTVTNSDPSELSFAQGLLTSAATNITIPAGQSVVVLDIHAVADRVVDANQSVTLTASAAGYDSASATVTVLNVDLPTLTLSVGTNAVTEGFTTSMTVTRDAMTNNSLSVALTSSSPGQLSPPNFVTILAGANSVTFAVLAVDDPNAEAAATYSISASAGGVNSGLANVIVLDNDVPHLTVSLSTHSISEGAGPQALSMTVTREPGGSGALNIEPTADDGTLLTLPLRITIPPGQASRSFPVGVIDDTEVNGQRSVVLSAYALAAGSNERLSEAIPDVIKVTDDDGPTLQLVAALNLVREGQNPATTVTVTRNTPATNSLIVNLASSRTNEALVPATVTLSNGISSITFPLTSVADGTNDGNQTVTLTAAAPGFTEGVETVIVSDTDLPDLLVSSITAPASGVPQQRVGIGWRVVNQGVSTASGEFLTRVYASGDAVVGGDDVLVAQFRNTNAVGVRQFIESTEQIELPLAVGNYWIVVETDAEQTVEEVLENNNIRISAGPIVVAADYGAWVQAGTNNAPANTSVPLYGRATNSLGAPVSGKVVNIHVLVRGTQRIISAITDAIGGFTTTFTPLPNEAGRYELFATHPGVSTAPVQDTFSLLGFRANPSSVSLTVVESLSRSGSLTLENLSDVSLTGLAVEVVSKPTNLNVTTSLDSSELATHTSLHYSFMPTTADAYGTVQLRVTSAEGVSQDVLFGVSVEPLRPRLVATPVSLYAAMPVGGQAVVEFDVANLGGRDTGPITVSLPVVPWMHIASTNPMPSLAPGQTNRVTLVLTPATNLVLGPYTGSLAISADNSGTSVPFNFRAISESVGDLLVDVVDEFTYYAEGAPHLAGATVTIRDSVTQLSVTNGVTGANGLFIVTNLNQAYYDIEVTADKHTSYRATHFLKAGMTNEVQSFVSRQTVTYTWLVEPVEIEDRYKVTVDTTFEAVVPMAVVTLDPPLIDLRGKEVEAVQLDLKIVNHGLVTAELASLYFGDDVEYEIVPLIKELGNLQPRSSVTVPLTIRRRARFASLADAGDSSGACIIEGGLRWSGICGERKYYSVPTRILPPRLCGLGMGLGDIFIRVPQPPTGPSLPGGGFARVTGPGTSIGIDICDPCLRKRIQAVNKCLEKFLPLEDWEKCVKDSYKCASELPLGFSKDLVYKCFKATYNCLKSIGKTIPGPWKYLKYVECPCELLTACRDRTPPPFATLCYPFVDSPTPPPFDGLRSPTLAETPEFPSELSEVSTAFSKLYPVVNYFSSLFGDPAWFEAEDQGGVSSVLDAFTLAIEESSSRGIQIAPDELSALRDHSTPAGVSMEQIETLARRWNRSVDNWDKGLFLSTDAPVDGSQDFIAIDTYLTSLTNAHKAIVSSEAKGYNSIIEEINAARDSFLRMLHEPSSGTCARVKLRLEQEAVLTRDAFRATLELDNNGASRLENVRVDVNIRPESGNAHTNLFAVRLESMPTVLSAVDGTGILAGNSTGTAKWLIIPTVDAAPTVATRFFVGGTLSYRLDGNDVTVPLSEVPITVLPSPRLALQYFHQRDVFSDDPFTDRIEPTIPYSLAVMVKNRGYGQAKNFRISSAQPEIIENEKGLLIDFNIIATEVFKAGTNYGLTPSLTANFGDISAGDTAIGRWLLTSTLQGLFIDYSARFEHIDGLGNPRLSLIDEVSIHEMNHLVHAGGIWEDGKPDFLVNEVPDIRDLPDTLYQSNGSTNHVELVEQSSIAGTLSPSNVQVTLTAPTPGDWVYLRVPNPGNGVYRLTRVTRSDGTNIALNTNVWTTDRTFIGLSQRPRLEHILHLLDYNSTGSYTLTYEPGSDIVEDPLPPVSSVNPLPALSGEYFQVSWSGRDEGLQGRPLAGIAYYDIYVSMNGGRFTNWLPRTTLVSATYVGTTGARYAFFSVATDANGNPELAPGTPDTETLVNLKNSPPSITISNVVVIDEGQTLDLPFTVSDPDTEQLLSVSLTGKSPPGLQLSALPRRLTWITGEGNGPSTNLLTLVVHDDGFPTLSATSQVTVIVREVNSAPTLETIPNFRISEGQLLTHSVRGTDFDLPTQVLKYSLGSGAPAGARIDSTSGVFTWRPTDNQGGTTNRIMVIVSDNGTPSLSATQSFQVVVRNSSPDFILNIGTTNLLVGQASEVPLYLRSGSELNALSLRVVPSNGALTNFSLQPVAAELSAASLSPDGTNAFRIRLSAASGQLLPSDGVLAKVFFTASAQEHSSIVTLPVNDLTGTLASGGSLGNGLGNGGRVFVIGKEPLLDATLGTNSSRSLVLYGKPGETYEIQATTNLQAPQIWLPVRVIELVDRFDIWSPLSSDDPTVAYRGAQLPSPASVRFEPVTLLGDGRIQLRFDGVSNRLYQIEASTNLIDWIPVSTNRAPIQLTTPAGSAPVNRFFRVRFGALCTEPPPGLIAWWPGEGNAQDVIGKNHGTMLNGVGFAPGAVGQGFKFDGVDDYINVGRASQLRFEGTNSFSFSFWMAPENTGSPADIITRFNIGTGVAWELYSDEHSQVSFWTRATAVPQDLVSSPTVPYRSFTHVVMSYDGSTKRIYLNGKLDSSVISAPMFPFHDEDVDVLIGIRFISGQPYYPNSYRGMLDEIQVFTRALTDEEVRSIYQTGGAGLCIP